MEHEHHDTTHNVSGSSREYLKFISVLVSVTLLSYLHVRWQGFYSVQFAQSFMGVFFVVFASFKLFNLKVFAYGFQSYDLIAKKSLKYSFSYPFIQLVFGVLYLISSGGMLLDTVVLAVSLVAGAGVLQTLGSGAKVHCVCLGNIIKLPLSTISFVEDFGMAAMAVFMLMVR